jgi:hypothetical protein
LTNGTNRSEYQHDILGRGNPAGIHLHSYWQARANDPELAIWLRIVALAYASHRKNGHATFYMAGESTLPRILGKSKRAIQNELKKAIARGFLAEGSNANCLILPDGIFGGAEGHKFADCKLHATR